MRYYILHWLDNAEEMIQGPTVFRAIGKAGYNMKDMIFLDYYKDITQTMRPRSLSKSESAPVNWTFGHLETLYR